MGLLAGIALDEGKIHSLDDPASRYIPAYTKGMQADVTLRHLLTMSGGMAWDEAYASLFLSQRTVITATIFTTW